MALNSSINNASGMAVVELFDGTDWFTWSYKMKNFLLEKDLWEVVTDMPDNRPTKEDGATVQRAWEKKK